MELLDSISDEEALTIALHNLALAHAEEQDWDAAETSFARCLEIAERRGDRSVIAGVLLNQDGNKHCDGNGQLHLYESPSVAKMEYKSRFVKVPRRPQDAPKPAKACPPTLLTLAG